MAFLEIKNVTYQYPLSEVNVIKDLSFKFDEGKIYAIIGKNGSGKTTLCNIIRGFIPDFYQGTFAGEVCFEGKNISDYSIEQLSDKIGYCSQNPFTQISSVKDTVFNEIAFGLENFGVDPDEIKQRVNEIVELFHLEDLVDRNPTKLSGGQMQRVAIASIVVLDPKVIILDEPTSQLDPKGTSEIFEIIKILKQKGKTVILVEQKIDYVAEYCDYVLLISDGKLVMDGSAEEVLSNPEIQQYGIAMPQIPAFYLEYVKKNGLDSSAAVPLTVDAACQLLK